MREPSVADQGGTRLGTRSHNIHQGSVPGAVPEFEGSGDASTFDPSQHNIIRKSLRRKKAWNARSTGSWMIRVPDVGHYVYIAWGIRYARPLYVGLSSRLLDRIGTHVFEREWGSKVRRFEFYAFPTAEEAAQAELQAIIDLNPIHNIRRIHPSYRGISDDQAEIIRRVQNRRRQDSEGGQG